MFNPLVEHAIRNVWCTPDQDKQVIINAARITKINGVWNNTVVNHRSMALPTTSDSYHIYQVGRLHPGILGLFDKKNKWESFASCCNRQTMIINVYSNNGLQIPLSNCYYRVTDDRNLLIAVMRDDALLYDFNTRDIFFRVYTNDWFTSNAATATDNVVVQGGKMGSSDEILALQTAYESYLNQPGKVLAYVNGRLKHAINLITVQIGDTAEFVYDSSISKIVDISIGLLTTFNSVLDNTYKYLLHHQDLYSDKIEFYDDIDFYIIKKNINTVDGLYYHRNEQDAVRMITHCDYSLKVSQIDGMRSTNSNWADINGLHIRVIIRNTGYQRELVNDTNRIMELYKLPPTKRLQSMTGVNAVVSNWQVNTLEYSVYTEIMRSRLPDININKVEQAYGYNTISKILGDTPKKTRVFSGKKLITLPYGLIDMSTAYEYDANGLLLDWHHHTHGYHYNTASQDCELVEVISGIGSSHLDDVFGQQTQTLAANLDYRMYVCGWFNGEPDNKWIDVTDTGLYAILNNTLTWLTDPETVFTCVRSNRYFLAYDLGITPVDGLLRFSLDQYMQRDNSNNLWVMQIPMGELELFLNGRSLIEGLDYHVNFPEIVIVNKKFLKHPVPSTPQKVIVRYTGFCKSDMKHRGPTEVGFVDHLLLSNNSKFDIRDDKVMRIVVNGSVKHRDDLLFAEDSQGVTSIDSRNGDPYVIRDIVVPTRGYTNTKTYPLREAAMITDKRIGDYMSLWIPKPVFPGPNIIDERYPVFSPFLCKIITEIKLGNLNDTRMYETYNDETVYDICQPFEYLLKYDPTQDGLRPDDNYVIVHPHNLNAVLNVTVHQYKFLMRVVRLYLKDRVTLSHFVSITS